MLQYLLDEHLSPVIADQLTAQRPDIPVVALRSWQGGAQLGADDTTILSAAAEQGVTLVTYDLRTIVPLLKAWGEQGIHHSGVVLVHPHTLPPIDIGGLLRTLIALWDAWGHLEWTDRVIYLHRWEGRSIRP